MLPVGVLACYACALRCCVRSCETASAVCARPYSGCSACTCSHNCWVRASAAFIAALYCLNLVLGFALRGAYRFGAWDVFMLWFIVDGMLLSSWVELLRKRADKLAGKDEA